MCPFFSVIVPVYNVENYIHRCVQSLLEQTCGDLEILLVDDGSTDASGSICDAYARQFGQITVIHKENGGLASARNAGMAQARGTYLSFLDADDWLEKETYRILRSHIAAQQPDIVNFGCRKLYGGKTISREHAVFPAGIYTASQIRSRILPDSIAREKAFAQINLPVQLSACMCIYKRSFLQSHAIGFTSERTVLCEDWLFNITCLCRAESMVILHDILYHYDTRENSLSQSYKPDSYIRRQKLYRCYREVLEQSGNATPENRKRLKNFWMESIYCCYIIECLSPVWNREVRRRMDLLCREPLFVEYSQALRVTNCTPKGLAFIMITRLKLHFLFRLVYRRSKGIR